ncbi:MAG: hypothetical protein ACR2HQ_11965 [Ilumatobacteraceae bacterium]
MSATTDSGESSGPGVKSIVGIAAVAHIACCIGPILAVSGAVAALGVASTNFIGAAGLLIAAAAVVTFIVVRRRRTDASRAASPELVPVELTRHGP